MIRHALAAVFAFWSTAVAATPCEDITWEDTRFTVCTVDMTQNKLSLFLADADGDPYGTFAAIEGDHGPLRFAMNAGMFHPDKRPVGLFQLDGVIEKSIVLRAGPGNFGMLPNGVFCFGDGFARVIESRVYQPADCTHATQSGPMLVIDGALHPRFIRGSTSRFIRNGVGTSDDEKRAVFVISNQVVNFHTFARFFRDHLGLSQALYFDGNVSQLYAPGLNRKDFGRSLGPIVGLLED